jgi:hypothetical protein
MEILASRINQQMERATARQKTVDALMLAQAMNRVRLECELARLRRMEEAVRNMAKADPAVAQMLRLLDAG